MGEAAVKNASQITKCKECKCNMFQQLTEYLLESYYQEQLMTEGNQKGVYLDSPFYNSSIY